MKQKDYYTADKYVDFWLMMFRKATAIQALCDIHTAEGASKNTKYFRIQNFCRKKLHQRINHLQPNRQLYS